MLGRKLLISTDIDMTADLIGTKEASEIRGCTIQTVGNLCRRPDTREKIGGVKIGRDWFVDREKFLAFEFSNTGRPIKALSKTTEEDIQMKF